MGKIEHWSCGHTLERGGTGDELAAQVRGLRFTSCPVRFAGWCAATGADADADSAPEPAIQPQDSPGKASFSELDLLKGPQWSVTPPEVMLRSAVCQPLRAMNGSVVMIWPRPCGYA